MLYTHQREYFKDSYGSLSAIIRELLDIYINHEYTRLVEDFESKKVLYQKIKALKDEREMAEDIRFKARWERCEPDFKILINVGIQGRWAQKSQFKSYFNNIRSAPAWSDLASSFTEDEIWTRIQPDIKRCLDG